MPLRHLKDDFHVAFRNAVIGCASFNLVRPMRWVRVSETPCRLKGHANTRHLEDAAATVGSPRLSFGFIDFRVREGQVSILR